MADTSTRTRAWRSCIPRRATSAPVATTAYRPLLTRAQIQSYEALHTETWDVRRRLTLSILGRSRHQLQTGFMQHGNAQVLEQTLKQVQLWKEHLQAHIALADAALARLHSIAV